MTTPEPREPGAPCSRCPRLLGRSCCEAGEGRLATLTRADIARISAATGQAKHRFAAEEWLAHDEAWRYELERPAFRGYFREGPRRLTLRTRSGGACVFLGPRGCTLDEATRPLACRLYPFTRLADGSWSILPPKLGEVSLARASGEACLAVEEAEEMDALLAAFGTTRAQLDTLDAALRAAVADAP